jgi:magnesium transporter
MTAAETITPAIATPLQETAARHLVARVPTASTAETADAVRTRLAGGEYDAMDAVYLVDEARRLLGLVRLPRLFAAAPGAWLAGLMEEVPAVQPHEDQERVATLAIRARLAAVPVVSADRVLLGVVPAETLIDILRREHIEDMQRFVGIRAANHQAVHALTASPLIRARERLPWLLVGLAGSMIATAIMARFEATLAAQLAVAFFVPGIVYLADAIGTQSEAIAVRGLSFNNTSVAALVAGELVTGMLIGLVLGSLAWPVVWLAFADAHLATAVAVAIVAAGSAATTIGLVFPWILSRFGIDPALGSGPVATIVQDVLSLLVYFALVMMLVV